jgi:rubrerythrin
MERHETQPTEMGMNRTGVGIAPGRFREMTEASPLQPAADPTALALANARAELSREAPPVGVMPPPTTLKGAGKAAVKALKGEKTTVFLDRLGERLAFERTGVRLYDAVLAKIPASKTEEGTLSGAELRRLRDEELEHMHLVRETLEELGADPTTVTPGADLTGVQGMGLVQAVTDPRTTLTQCLDAVLVAELADNDGWKVLIAMAEALGQNELAQRFAQALTEEDQHLALVRRWISERLEIQLGAKMPPLEFGEPARPA